MSGVRGHWDLLILSDYLETLEEGKVSSLEGNHTSRKVFMQLNCDLSMLSFILQCISI